MASVLRSAMRSLKNSVLQYDDVEILIREATSNDPWGASSSLMQEVANATFSYDKYPKIFNMLWKRVTDYAQIRHVHKALHLIEYLLKNGNERFIVDVKERVDDIARLRSYKYIEDERDIAGDVRQKAASLYNLIVDDNRLAKERENAKSLQGKFKGYSGSTIRYAEEDNSRGRADEDPFQESEEDDAKPKKTSQKAKPSGHGHKASPATKKKADEYEEEHYEEEQPQPRKVTSKKKSITHHEEDGGSDDFSQAFSHSSPSGTRQARSASAALSAPPASSSKRMSVVIREQNQAASAKSRPAVVQEDEFDFGQSQGAPQNDDIDFLSSSMAAMPAPSKKQSSTDWTEAFSKGAQATAPAPAPAPKKQAAGPASWSFDAAPAEFEDEPFEQPQQQQQQKSNDLWDIASDLIQSNGKKPVQAAKPAASKGQSIRELKQQQQQSSSDDYFSTIQTSAPAKPQQSADPFGVSSAAPQLDAYGLPIVAKPVAAPANPYGARSSVSAAPAYGMPAYGAQYGMAPMNPMPQANPFGAPYMQAAPAAKPAAPVDPFSGLSLR